MAFVCSATWTAQPGKEDVVREALTVLAPASRNEPGCQTYVVHQDPEQPSVFKIFEVYDDEDAFKKHATYPHFEEHALGKAIPALANRERVFTTVLDV
ncbi:antibiotic biosynthesis monooxygenase [Geodermatophilus sabuli]|uniref:Antibiotic biosynthesis monooxygenase n=1 Tax=Geodermatophilus sabuli TaxID=1564158 RepID=A0A7K3VY26_9ACTN|nr:putative quinol monooxygenase [Geodermatophilus sabuli]NEK56774.1 antibiotic biosynthesis monooxygenase [Geodermatophilus sabuli]